MIVLSTCRQHSSFGAFPLLLFYVLAEMEDEVWLEACEELKHGGACKSAISSPLEMLWSQCFATATPLLAVVNANADEGCNDINKFEKWCKLNCNVFSSTSKAD
ncbi:hypothetical protein GW17_00048309 [Ensete ventricosum]|nr:hypothetical protein GW17_00048309 [Ensete ventricosum]